MALAAAVLNAAVLADICLGMLAPDGFYGYAKVLPAPFADAALSHC